MSIFKTTEKCEQKFYLEFLQVGEKEKEPGLNQMGDGGGKKEREQTGVGSVGGGGGRVGLRQVGEGCWVGSGVGVGALLLLHFTRT